MNLRDVCFRVVEEPFDIDQHIQMVTNGPTIPGMYQAFTTHHHLNVLLSLPINGMPADPKAPIDDPTATGQEQAASASGHALPGTGGVDEQCGRGKGGRGRSPTAR